MKNLLIAAFVPGLIFAIGLGVAGMTRPDKVLGFLTLGPAWDPSLAFVMGGAIGVHFLAYRLVPRMKAPLFAPQFTIPQRTDIDRRLIGGAALFGIGWAIGGFCPGPGVVSAASGALEGMVFMLAMLAGMNLYQQVDP